MSIQAGQSVSFSEIGGKGNQEDSLYPSLGVQNPGIPLFLVCDGVGGQDQGEVASAAVCEAFECYYSTHALPATADELEPFFDKALTYAYDQLDAKDSTQATGKSRMGTTLTCVFILDNCCLAAHIGDSRIYHIRPQAKYPVKYQSNDHSLVNYLVNIGEIRPEEAATHPQRNVILRAMQPHGDGRAEAEVCLLDELHPGDYLFLCTDGVLEKLTENDLCEVLASAQSDAEKMERIRLLCEGSYDNYSALLVPLIPTAAPGQIEDQPEEQARIKEQACPEEQNQPEEQNETGKSWFKKTFHF